MPRSATPVGERPFQIDSSTGSPVAELDRLCRPPARASLFNGLACEDIARFARGVRELRIARGEILFHRGDPCHGFHLILDGQIKLASPRPRATRRWRDIPYAGRSFGEAVMFMDKPYVVMAQALTDATLLHIGKQVFFEEMAGDPVFCRKIIAGLAQRLHLLMADVESYRCARAATAWSAICCAKRNARAMAFEAQVSLRLPTSKGTIA